LQPTDRPGPIRDAQNSRGAPQPYLSEAQREIAVTASSSARTPRTLGPVASQRPSARPPPDGGNKPSSNRRNTGARGVARREQDSVLTRARTIPATSWEAGD